MTSSISDMEAVRDTAAAVTLAVTLRVEVVGEPGAATGVEEVGVTTAHTAAITHLRALPEGHVDHPHGDEATETVDTNTLTRLAITSPGVCSMRTCAVRSSHTGFRRIEVSINPLAGSWAPSSACIRPCLSLRCRETWVMPLWLDGATMRADHLLGGRNGSPPLMSWNEAFAHVSGLVCVTHQFTCLLDEPVPESRRIALN